MEAERAKTNLHKSTQSILSVSQYWQLAFLVFLPHLTYSLSQISLLFSDTSVLIGPIAGWVPSNNSIPSLACDDCILPISSIAGGGGYYTWRRSLGNPLFSWEHDQCVSPISSLNPRFASLTTLVLIFIRSRWNMGTKRSSF